MKRFSALLFVVFLIGLAATANADCTSTGLGTGSCTERQIKYNTDYHTYQFCDGTGWVNMGRRSGAGSGGAGCSSPTGSEPQIRYSSDYHGYQFCDGANWVSMGPTKGIGGSGCTSPTGKEGVIVYNPDYHIYQFCDGANWIAMGMGPGAAIASKTYNCVFTTSTTTNGGFVSVAAADTACANRATAGNLGGTYKAWVALTTGVDDPATTFTHSTLPYKRVDGTTVANNWTDLTDGTLAAAISTDETGTPVPGTNVFVWTNVATNGTAKTSGSSGIDNCAAWTNTTGGKTALIGNARFTDSRWTDNLDLACNGVWNFYCFQQ